MPRKRQIPKESKTLKFLYVIKVRFRGEELVKLGISHSWILRVLHQYRNENTNGFVLDVYKIFKGKNVKRIEAVVKWRMTSFYSRAYKQEYFPMEYKDIIISEVKKAFKYFGYPFKEIDFKSTVKEQMPDFNNYKPRKSTIKE